MKKLRAYYAHFMGIYDTPMETLDIQTLENLGFEVINPNRPEIQLLFQKTKEKYPGDYLKAFDELFGGMVRECDIFAFRAVKEENRLTGGVVLELKVALKENKLILELPNLSEDRFIDKWETLDLLKKYGKR